MSALRAGNIGTIVLDECHHLASMWGYVVRAVLDELGDEDVHVIGLTATPPSDLDRATRASCTRSCSGRSTSRSRRRPSCATGHLAPYQELAWLTEPLDSERAWLAEHDTRFKELDHRAARRRRERRTRSRAG